APRNLHSFPTRRSSDLEHTFTLQLPDGVNAAQDEATETSIELNAGDAFNQDVAVTLKAPQGITITPSEFTLNKNQTEQKLRILRSEEHTSELQSRENLV